MKTNSAALYEQKFREFLFLRKQWIELIEGVEKYSSINSFGQRIRPIGVTSDPVILQKARLIIRDWENFANFADTFRDENETSGTQSEYLPIPFIVAGSRAVSVNEGSAQAISKHSREKILRLLEMKLATRLREHTEDDPEVIDTRFDIERFSAYPEGTLFRRRLTGYSDTLIMSYGVDNTDNTYRVGSWGALIDSRLHERDITLCKKDKKITSFYDYCTPIPCCLHETGTFYLDDEAIRVKAERAAENKIKKALSYKTKKAKLQAELAQVYATQ